MRDSSEMRDCTKCYDPLMGYLVIEQYLSDRPTPLATSLTTALVKFPDSFNYSENCLVI